MSSKIIASTSSGTALNMSADTSGILEIQTGATPTTAITVDASQNVGIGTSSPTNKLQVSGTGTVSSRTIATDTGGDASFFVQNSASNLAGPLVYGTTKAAYGALGSGESAFYSNVACTLMSENILKFAAGGNTERMRIDSSGNIGIGTSTAPQVLSIKRNSSIGWMNSAGNGSDQILYADGSSNLGFYTNASERMRIDSSGNLLVGTTTPYVSSRFRVRSGGATSATYNLECSNSSATTLFTVRDDGYFITGVAAVSPYNATVGSAANCFINSDGGLYRSTSSLKYKTDIQDATHGLTDVLKLRSVTYKGKSKADGNKVYGGLIAEEVDAIGLSEFVVYRDDDGTPDALNYGNMVALAFKAIQEQQALITDLTTRLAALEGAK